MASQTIRKRRRMEFLKRQGVALERKLKECLKNQRRAAASLSIDEDALSDPADLVNAQLSQEMSCLANIRSSQQIDQIRLALLRLDEGMYQTCENCAGAIKKKRLKAVPWATRCLACQTAHSG